MSDLNSLLNWIETHSATVAILKWAVLLLVAWATGLVRFIRNLTRKPLVQISEPLSRCLVEEFAEIEGHRNADRASFLIDIEVINRSTEEIVVRTLSLRVGRTGRFRHWGQKVSAVSLPSRVYHKMGAGTKVMRNWFAHFPDGNDRLTVAGPIGPRHTESGFALFVSFTHGNWNPAIVDGCTAVEVEAGLTTGTIRTKARITVTRNTGFFEEMVPGIREQIAHPTAWNVPLRNSSAS